MPRLELLTTELVDRAAFLARSKDRVGFGFRRFARVNDLAATEIVFEIELA
jgi:hypothetical protein